MAALSCPPFILSRSFLLLAVVEAGSYDARPAA